MSLKSNDIKQQEDYMITMDMINEMLSIKAILGSEKIGRKYADFYNQKITEMLKDENVNIEILAELQNKVDRDLSDVREDCNHRRGMSPQTDKQIQKNNHMMSMIMDFIKTLPKIISVNI